ncbi:uncharacterized protein LOC143899751 isoform X1 [Temnothorax americanus]|uniref:uncharacterized protein LOC143899751 isoform X1 n=1 Tax=Temnothorax americanus TaxID=1964332 RepID=UPI00406976BD
MNAAKLSVQRKRAQNFSEKEKLILTEIVLKYKNIIENKRTDGVTSKDKEKCWKVIENNYNSTSSSTEFRSAEVLKSCWENLKKKTRKFFADERIQLYKTGGGPCESQTDIVLERVRDIIKPSVEGIKSDFDCDAIEDVYTDQSTNNACKIPTKTNSCETSSDSIEMDEWLPVDDNDNDQDDVLLVRDYLQENAGAMRQNSFDNVSDGHEMTNYDKENDIIGNDSVSDVNGNSSVFMRENNTQHCLKKSNIQNIKKPEKQDVQNTSAVQILKRKISTPLQVKTNDLNYQYKSKKLNRQDNKLYKKKKKLLLQECHNLTC